MLSDEELDRYARHLVLREIGGRGQSLIKSANVAVIGAGGLGSPCLLYLAAAGIGRLTIIDDDTVALSNLQRQVIFTTADTGRPKTEAATEHLTALNPHVQISPQTTRLAPENAIALLANHTHIADGCDSFATRLAVSDAAQALKIPLISGAVGSFDGQVATFKGHDPALPCYRCLVGNAHDQNAQSCAESGILGALTGVIGAMMALEVIRDITGFGDPLAGRLLLYDALGARMRTVRLPKDPNCPGCGVASL
ncbi:thiamine biosynthesis protein ThiF [Polymorphobacter glacialis]|uniref:Molybdopterin-synthase adenylyltransferase n=1 Tax=Sandarakinorhabdus glacialis TaxID=1614636 RepID=A0A916ZTG3_9SPHN|nr:molybdopterin-synthase adenylyltransferase MoeB [Polymorphobacter glacialis]GGE11763.1 thiamine biosynthesis protein ThiF [Polymorphobacter glacialis]